MHTVYRVLEGELNSKMAAHHDVIKSSAVNAVNRIREVYRNNSSIFQVTLMKFSE